MTLISVAVVSRPVNAHQSFTTRPAPITSDPRFTVPAYHTNPSAPQQKKNPCKTRTHHEGNLEQTAQLVLVLDTCLGVNQAALVRNRTVAADEDVVRDRLAEDFDLEHVCDDLLCLAVDVGVHQCDVVVARDDVPEGGEALFYPLDGDCVG
jgi:hypothetical protein